MDGWVFSGRVRERYRENSVLWNILFIGLLAAKSDIATHIYVSITNDSRLDDVQNLPLKIPTHFSAPTLQPLRPTLLIFEPTISDYYSRFKFVLYFPPAVAMLGRHFFFWRNCCWFRATLYLMVRVERLSRMNQFVKEIFCLRVCLQ